MKKSTPKTAQRSAKTGTTKIGARKAGAGPAAGGTASPVGSPTVAAAPKANGPKPVKKHARASGLDAAARVLAQSGKPMRCAELTRQILDKGLWKTGGKTPAATISAAIIREISTKGKDSRFRKVDRGMFEAGKAAR